MIQSWENRLNYCTNWKEKLRARSLGFFVQKLLSWFISLLTEVARFHADDSCNTLNVWPKTSYGRVFVGTDLKELVMSFFLYECPAVRSQVSPFIPVLSIISDPAFFFYDFSPDVFHLTEIMLGLSHHYLTAVSEKFTQSNHDYVPTY